MGNVEFGEFGGGKWTLMVGLGVGTLHTWKSSMDTIINDGA